MAIRIGINPLTWSNDDLPSLGAHIPLERCLKEGRQAGYAGFELGHKFPRDSAVLGPLLRAHDLSLVSGWYSMQLCQREVAAEIEAVQPHLSLLRDLGSQVMVCAEVSGCIHGDQGVPLSRRPQLDDAGFARFAQRLAAFAKYLQQEGVRLAYHHHMGTVVESESDIRRLMAATPEAVGLLLDTGHLACAGGDPVTLATAFAERIVHLHCKDIRPGVLRQARAGDWSFLDAVLEGVFTVPGDGCVDFAGVLAALPADYHGWIVVEAEQDPERAEPLTYARMGYQHLAGLLVARKPAVEEGT